MKNKLKILAVFLGCLLFRLVPLRAPNVEPIMASVMPVAKKYGAVLGFFFAVLSMVLYDLITGHVGSWTWITALAYGVVGAGASLYFQKFKTSAGNFAIFAVLGTLFFDVVTGILPAPLFGQSLATAALLQVPFTALHLAGNVSFAFLLSPVLSRWLASEPVSATAPKISSPVSVRV
jgi:uncharacterized membrane protein